jgi:hypothetical protein
MKIPSFLYRVRPRAARRRWLTLAVWMRGIGRNLRGRQTPSGDNLEDDFNLPDSEWQQAYDPLAERSGWVAMA